MRRLFPVLITPVIACTSSISADDLLGSAQRGGDSPDLVAISAAAPPSLRKVLIYGPTYGGSHDLIGTTPNTEITVWDGATWASKTTADFSAFDAIVFGDFPRGLSDCFIDQDLWHIAIATRSQWQPAITGNIVVLGTDPEFHRKDQLIHQAVEFVTNDREPGPGLYAALSCAYQLTTTATTVLLLQGIGDFQARSSGCGNQAIKIAPHQVLTSISDAYLSNWNCSTHDGFDSWPETFIPLALVTDTPNPTFTSSKGIVGEVYMLVSATSRNRWRPSTPGNFHESYLDWSMDGSISTNDGLVLSNVTLGSRFMARTISLPYLNLATTKFASTRLELEGTGRGKASKLIGFIISHLPDRLLIEATYKFDQLPKGSKSQLFVTQRYEFLPEIDEKTTPALACEPSQSSGFPVSVLSPGIPCARFRPIVDYTFVGQNGEQIVSLNSVQRLHFTPDEAAIQASALIHDCKKNESGTGDEPCIYTLTPWNTFTIPGSIFTGSLGPGIKLKNNQNPLMSEVMEEVVRDGTVPGPWDNVHLTNASSVLLPVPIPPGCPECVHIHWRWADEFGAQFGNGLPMIHNDFVTDPFSAPTSTNPDSLQNVTVALTVAHQGEEDPRDFTTLLTPAEALPSPLGAVMWYSATSKGTAGNAPIHDEFFNHGGFYSTLGGPADLRTSQLLMLPPFQTEVHAGDRIHVRVIVENLGPRAATNVTIVDGLPAGAIFDDANSFDGVFTGPCTFDSGFVGCNFPASIVNGGGGWIDVFFHMPGAGSVVNNGLATAKGNSDPNAANNPSSLRINVLP